MNIGFLKTWDSKKGWGFIEDNEGYDYFVNISNIRKGQKLNTGDKIKFDISQGQRGPEAENVSKI